MMNATPASPPTGRLTNRWGRWFLIGLGALSLLCILVVTISAVMNTNRPDASPVIDHLSSLEKARLAEAIHLRQSTGDEIWPGFGAAEIPLIVYNEAYAFLVNYRGDPPPGWTNVSTSEPHGGPWKTVPEDDFQGQAYYRQPLPSGDETPQAFTVLVGEIWVASMTTKDWTEITMINMIADQLPGPLAAIFPYGIFTSAFNSDWHIAAISHESFHAFQGQQARPRLEAAESAHAAFLSYPFDQPEVRDAWQQEFDLLADALLAENEIQIRSLVAEFLSSRAARRVALNLAPELIDAERQREWLEGQAKYIELAIWRQGSLADHRPLPLVLTDPDFDAYAKFASQFGREISQLRRSAGAQQDSLDIGLYYSGMAQAFLLDRLMPGWQARAFEQGVFLEDLLVEALE